MVLAAMLSVPEAAATTEEAAVVVPPISGAVQRASYCFYFSSNLKKQLLSRLPVSQGTYMAFSLSFVAFLVCSLARLLLPRELFFFELILVTNIQPITG